MAREESILIGLRADLGIYDEAFDHQLIREANTAFTILFRLGATSTPNFRITGEDETWTEYENLMWNIESKESVRTILYYRVRLSFDPPNNSYLVEEMRKELAELEWQLTCDCDEYKRKNW